MENETTQIPLKKSTRQKLRNISTKGETYDELITKLVNIRNKFGEKEDLRDWFEKNYEILDIDQIEKDTRGDYIVKRGNKRLITKIETLSSDFIKKGLDHKDFDLLICILEDEKLPIETIEIIDRIFTAELSSLSHEGDGSKKIFLLLQLARMNANKKPYKIDTEKLAKKIEVEEKAIEDWHEDFSEEEMIEIINEEENDLVRLTEKGIEYLQSIKEKTEQSLKESLKKLKMEGKLVSGFGEGKYYVGQEGYKKQFRDKLGFDPFPGTLDLKLDSESLMIKEKLKQLRGEVIEGFSSEERSFGKAECFPAKIKGEEAAICLPDRTHHDEDIIEIISPVKIRDKYELEDGNKLELEVKI